MYASIYISGPNYIFVYRSPQKNWGSSETLDFDFEVAFLFYKNNLWLGWSESGTWFHGTVDGRNPAPEKHQLREVGSWNPMIFFKVFFSPIPGA